MTTSQRNPANSARDARLKAALRANLARRKAQGRARAEGEDALTDPQSNSEQQGSQPTQSGDLKPKDEK